MMSYKDKTKTTLNLTMSFRLKPIWSVVITIVLFASQSYGQDSVSILKNKLAVTPAEEQYNMYLSLSKFETDSTQSSDYLQEAINSAITNNTKDILTNIYMEAAKISFNKGYYNISLNYCNAAIDVATSENNYNIIAEAYKYYGWIYAK